MTHPVIIMGLGRIGAGRGAGRGLPNHLQAVVAQPNLRVTGLVDTAPAARSFVAETYPDLAPFLRGDLSEIPPGAAKETIVICGPTDRHEAMFEQALERAPRLIVVEKPAAADVAAAKRMLAAAEATLVLVNFHRRFDTRIARWRNVAPDAPRSVVARYGKGLWNYASHIVDLLLDWYGPVREVQALAGRRPADADPNLSFRCAMAAGFDAVVIGIDGLEYDQFEIEIHGRAELFEMRAGGSVLRRSAPAPSPHHDGYAGLQVVDSDGGTVDGFRELYDNIGAHFETGAPLGGCDLQTAVANAAVLEAALLSAERGGIAVAPEIPIGAAA